MTVISNNCGADNFGLWLLLASGQIKKMICSYSGTNRLFVEHYLAGAVDAELTPQGTLAERIRAGGAGIPAFYTRAGVGTVIAEGKPVEEFDGVRYIRGCWLRADLAIINARKAVTAGNLVFRRAARNFNPDIATAAAMTIPEIEEIVPFGALDPDHIHMPGIYVDRLVQGHVYSRAIEVLTTRVRPAEGVSG